MAKLSPADWKAVQAEFDRLVDLPPARRASAAAGSTLSPELQAEVQAMLAASDAPGMLDQPVAEVELSAEAYRSLPPGTRIGEFELGNLIGRGGMGEVYDAHRIGVDFRQRVAIKLLRPEAMAQAGLFDRERRLLAGLEHPGIARLIDGGVAPDGRAFMAMEYVDGLPITEDCKVRGADLAERLRLFREVCDAVSYAHARLVIHRDLKPSNIVVDDSGRVRLLDFGIAKLMDGAVPADATSGVATQIMVTPDYASPEQLANAPPPSAPMFMRWA